LAETLSFGELESVPQDCPFASLWVRVIHCLVSFRQACNSVFGGRRPAAGAGGHWAAEFSQPG